MARGDDVLAAASTNSSCAERPTCPVARRAPLSLDATASAPLAPAAGPKARYDLNRSMSTNSMARLPVRRLRRLTALPRRSRGRGPCWPPPSGGPTAPAVSAWPRASERAVTSRMNALDEGGP